MSASNDVNLHWLAFQYVADELSALEAGAFERRLAEDQAAREAVAEAVQISQAVALVGPLSECVGQPTRPAERIVSGWTLSGWKIAVTTTAACLALLLGPWFFGGSAFRPANNDDQNAATGESLDQIDRLVSVWTESQLVSHFFSSEAEGEDSAEASEDSVGGNSGRELSESEFSVPEWMIAAVSAEPDRDNDGTPDEGPLEN